jgi:LysM repeat protein
LALSVLNFSHVMNASNPFQIPSCLQTSFLQRRRERFKKGVIVFVAGTTVLLAVLLILGCNSEHARAASAMTVASAGSTGATAASTATEATETKIDSVPTPPAPSPIVALAAEPIVSKAGASTTASQPATVYVVKPADTLSRIAKLCRTTVSALKAANGLDTDRIAIGMKLKLPEV